MANILAIVDADLERRARFIRNIQPLIAPVEGLQVSSCEAGNFSAVWAATSAAPVSVATDRDGAAVLWGLAIAEERTAPLDARAVRHAWSEDVARRPPAFWNGFHA